MASTKCADDLPYEMLVEIFSNVNFEDLIHSVRHVCMRWKEVFQINLLWRDRIYCPKYTDSDNKIASVLEQTPKLQKLNMNQRTVQADVLQAIVQHCPHLKTLVFHDYQTLSIENLKDLVQKCPKIERFNIPHDVSPSFKEVEIIGQFINLHELSLGGYIDEEHPVQLKPLADGCPALRSIDLKDKAYTSDELAYFLLKKKDQLCTLSVRRNTAEFKSTIPLVSVCTALKTLHLDTCCDINIEMSFQDLRSLTTVICLTLRYLGYANVNDVISVFENRAMHQLVELRISCYHNYTDELGAVIVKNCLQLKVLYFKECHALSDESVESFHTLPELQYVNLNGTKISDGGMESIRKCKNLKYLSLKSCDNLTEGSMKLMTDFINLQVLKLDYCDIKGLPIHLIPSHLKHLAIFSINVCRNVDRQALSQLLTKRPDLIIHYLI